MITKLRKLIGISCLLALVMPIIGYSVDFYIDFFKHHGLSGILQGLTFGVLVLFVFLHVKNREEK